MTAVWIFLAVLFAALAALMLVAGLKLTAPGQPRASGVKRSGIGVDIEDTDALDPQA
jgi:hypothetical protein